MRKEMLSLEEAFKELNSKDIEESLKEAVRSPKGPWELMQKYEISIGEFQKGIVEYGRNDDPSGKRYFVKAYVEEPDMPDDIRYFDKDLAIDRARKMMIQWEHKFKREAYEEHLKDTSDMRGDWDREGTTFTKSELKGKFVKQ